MNLSEEEMIEIIKNNIGRRILSDAPTPNLFIHLYFIQTTYTNKEVT